MVECGPLIRKRGRDGVTGGYLWSSELDFCEGVVDD